MLLIEHLTCMTMRGLLSQYHSSKIKLNFLDKQFLFLTNIFFLFSRKRPKLAHQEKAMTT